MEKIAVEESIPGDATASPKPAGSAGGC